MTEVNLVPGDILYHKQWKFYDNSIGEKLFIAICSGSEERPCSMLMVTSQSARYQDATHGCNPSLKVFFIPLVRREWFDEPTYVSLPYRYQLPLDELMEGTRSKTIEVPGRLSTQCLAEIKNCLRNHFRRDFSDAEMKRTF